MMNSVRAVERAIDILEAMSAAPEGIKIAQLEERTGIARPTLYRLVRTLVNRRLLRQCQDPARYATDVGILALARPWTRSSALPAQAETALAALAAKVDETVALCVLRDKTRVYVREVVSRHPLNYSVGVGTTEPLLRGAGGLAILAFLGEDARQPFLSDVHASERTRLAREIDLVRARGFALSEGQILDGATAIAAPFFDRNEQVSGSVGVYGPSVRFADNRIPQIAKELIACAGHISRHW